MAEEERLDVLIQKATNPLNDTVDIAAIEAFCQQVIRVNDGPQLATRLIAHKIQSPQEKEALQSLQLLEACVRNCGPAFHCEVGKFRFLNELIKVVSPKYLGKRTPQSVRERVLQIMFEWTRRLTNESKVKDAYEMLRKQGVLTVNPPVPVAVEGPYTPPQQRAQNPIFDDAEKTRMLQKLLQSRNPEDLQAANRMIKSMVKEDERRVEKISRRVSELETVHNNVKVLSDMLDNHETTSASTEEMEVMKELYQSCQKLRPNLFRLAAETEEKDDSLNDILKASDEVGRVIERYEKLSNSLSQSTTQNEATALLDLDPSASSDVLQNRLSELGLTNDDLTDSARSLTDLDSLFDSAVSCHEALAPTTFEPKMSHTENTPTTTHNKGLAELDQLSEILLRECLPTSSKPGAQFPKPPEKDKISLNVLQQKQTPATMKTEACGQPSLTGADIDVLTNGASACSFGTTPQKNVDLLTDDVLLDISPVPATSTSHMSQLQTAEVPVAASLATLTVSLESIQPGPIPPLTVLETKNGVTVTLHFAKNRPRPDVIVIVVTTVSRNTSPVTNYLFQAVVPKTCKMKIQPPSKQELPPFSQFLPPPAITQVMLLSNPTESPISLKFILSYVVDDECMTEMGEVECLPIS